MLWRTYRRVADAVEPTSPKIAAPTTRSESDCPNGLNDVGASTVAVAPGSRSASVTTVWPRTTAGRSRRRSDAFLTVPLSRPSSSRRSVCTSGTVTAVSARIARSDEKPTPRSRMPAGSPWRTSSVFAVPLPPKKSPLIGRRQQRAARDAQLVDATRRREQPEIDLGRAIRGAGSPADDGHLVDDEFAAAQGGPEAVRPDGEDDDEGGHREPRPFAAVETSQDEVVDRPDQQDVRRAGRDQAADRRQGERRELGDAR